MRSWGYPRPIAAGRARRFVRASHSPLHRPRRPHGDDAAPRRREGPRVLREHERITREVPEGARRHRGEDDGRRLHGLVRRRRRRRVECAIAFQRAFAEHNAGGEADPRPHRPERRRASTRGSRSKRDGDLFGATVILASRIAAKAEGGEILVAERVRGVVPRARGSCSPTAGSGCGASRSRCGCSR